MPIKKILGKIHLWLGLASGIVVFVVAITGCIYAFKPEIENALQSYRFVKPQDAPTLPPSALRAIAEKELPGKHIHGIMYDVPDRAAQVYFFEIEPEYYYYAVFINPYTGEVTKVKDMEADFFQFTLNGHFYFWLPWHIGQPFVATMTLVFVVMLISGIVLWWPKNRKAAPQRFTIKWGARWRRKNYDLHNVLGFYASCIALLLGFTGLVWGFQWFAKGLHTVAGGKMSLQYYEPTSAVPAITANADRVAIDRVAIDRVWDLMKQEYPTAQTIEVHVPETDSSSIAANANPDRSVYWKTDYRYFNQYTLEELEVDHIYSKLENANAGDKLLRMNYDIHVGAIAGLPGKIIAFLASLIVASLPVTGFFVWWGRRNKKKEEAKKGKRKKNKKASEAGNYKKAIIATV